LESQANRVGLDPARIAVVLTERALIDPPAAVEMELEALRGMGVRLVLDGFGGGAIHLACLARLPLAMVRLHPSLCRDPGDDAPLRRLRQVALRLARDLDLDVIAEGIETDLQLEELRSLGCRWGQGPRFGPPQP
jgi:EAL domain-containing protein (putative c-di-GMP-specific phosphodiesterase class I)